MENTNALRVVGIAGSLRQASYNRALLRAAQELAPERLKIEIHDRPEGQRPAPLPWR